MNKTIISIILSILALMLISTSVSAYPHTCMVSQGVGHPLIPDTDCDGVVDPVDNCPFITNPVQRDAEGNGLGDACDLYIESITTNPADFVFNARAFNTYVTLHNNRDYNIRNLKVRVLIPELGIESVHYIDNLEVCSSETVEFFLRAPLCVPMNDYIIIVEASFMNLFGEPEFIPGITSIRVVPDKYCEMVLYNNQVIGNTIIDVMEIQDVYKGSEAVFPIRISNREFNDKEYIFTVTGLDGWGEYRLEPGSLIIVPSETDRVMDLYVKPLNNVPPGERVFVVSIQSGEEIQRFLLIANIKENPSVTSAFVFNLALKIILILVIAGLIVVSVIIGVKKYFSSLKQSEKPQYY